MSLNVHYFSLHTLLPAMCKRISRLNNNNSPQLLTFISVSCVRFFVALRLSYLALSGSSLFQKTLTPATTAQTFPALILTFR